MKIKDLVRDLTYEKIKNRRWRTPRMWRNGKKFLFTDYIISYDGIILRKISNGPVLIGKRLKIQTHKQGYKTIGLSINGKQLHSILIHRLMWETWIGRIPKELEINHKGKDGDKTNNQLSNLEVVTHKENSQHAKKNGLNWTEVHRIKVSKVHKGKKNSLKTRKKISKSLKSSEKALARKRNKNGTWK